MQGLTVPIAILLLIIVFVVIIVKALLELKGDDSIKNKVKEFVGVNLDILYAMRANILGDELLAKALQLKM